MKKRLLIITFVIAVILYFAVQFFFSFNASLLANWNITIPVSAGYSQIYEKHSEASFSNDGIRFHVIIYQSEEELEKKFAFREISIEEVDEVYEILDELDVKENIPKAMECGYWNVRKDDDELIILISRTDRLLYIIERYI